MKAVLDTNVLISCCWKRGGNEARVMDLVRNGVLLACVSTEILEEYREVAARKKFAGHRQCLQEAIAMLESRANRVIAGMRCDACADPDDNRLLECAAAGGAAFVVTGNLRHFPAEWEGVRIVNARRLLELLANGPGTCYQVV